MSDFTVKYFCLVDKYEKLKGELKSLKSKAEEKDKETKELKDQIWKTGLTMTELTNESNKLFAEVKRLKECGNISEKDLRNKIEIYINGIEQDCLQGGKSRNYYIDSIVMLFKKYGRPQVGGNTDTLKDAENSHPVKTVDVFIGKLDKGKDE